MTSSSTTSTSMTSAAMIGVTGLQVVRKVSMPAVLTYDNVGHHHHPHYYHHLCQSRRPSSLSRSGSSRGLLPLLSSTTTSSLISMSSTLQSDSIDEIASSSNLRFRKHQQQQQMQTIGASRIVSSYSTNSLCTGSRGVNHVRYREVNKCSTSTCSLNQKCISDQILRRDRSIVTRPDEDRRRQTIVIEKKNDEFGFTLQTYGIHHRTDTNNINNNKQRDDGNSISTTNNNNNEVELLTYVDSIDPNGPASKSGLREGDVILSINGHAVERSDHRTLVDVIKCSGSTIRMVVLFEDCIRKIELRSRVLNLKAMLSQKVSEYERLCIREEQLLSKTSKKSSSKNLLSYSQRQQGRSLENSSHDSNSMSSSSNSMTTSSTANKEQLIEDEERSSMEEKISIVSSGDISLDVMSCPGNGNHENFAESNKPNISHNSYHDSNECYDDVTKQSKYDVVVKRDDESSNCDTCNRKSTLPILKNKSLSFKKLYSSKYSSLFHPTLSRSFGFKRSSSSSLKNHRSVYSISSQSEVYSNSFSSSSMKYRSDTNVNHRSDDIAKQQPCSFKNNSSAIIVESPTTRHEDDLNFDTSPSARVSTEQSTSQDVVTRL